MLDRLCGLVFLRERSRWAFRKYKDEEESGDDSQEAVVHVLIVICQ